MVFPCTDHDHVDSIRHHDHFELAVRYDDHHDLAVVDHCIDCHDYYETNGHYSDWNLGYTHRYFDPNRSRECLESFFFKC